MKKFFTAVLMAVALVSAIPSQAQIKWGLKGGYNVTTMSLSKDVIDKSNQTGFFIGPTVKFTLPIVGLGVDVAALYDQREAKLKDTGVESSKNISEKNINIPINVRYGFGLGSIASAYVAVGPQFGFNVGNKNFTISQYEDKTLDYSLKKTNFSVNVGVGVSLISHIEIGCNYNIACGKTGDVSVSNVAGKLFVPNKNRTNAWQVYLAYYF